jgi:outer membrane lipopolysaccharide assembly protein LptE/RlpB
MPRTTSNTILATVSLCLLVGCGYALVGRGSNIPVDVRRVYLEPLENRTTRSQVEQFLSQAIADELVTRQRFSLAAGAAEADAVLAGSVVAFTVTPITFDADGRASEYEISITAQMSFERTGSEEVLWSNDRYVFRETYQIDPSEAGFFDRENVAIEGSAERFAETVVTDLLEGF